MFLKNLLLLLVTIYFHIIECYHHSQISILSPMKRYYNQHPYSSQVSMIEKKNKNRYPMFLHMDELTTTVLEGLSVSGGLYLLLQLGIYWKMQFITAGKY